MSAYTFDSDTIANAFTWKEELGTVEWCKENIYLAQDVTPYTGMISFEKTPWIEDILNDWDKPWIEEFNIMASTQVGKTTIEFCCIAKELDTDPCMMQLTVPTDDGVGDFVKTKFDPFFRGIKSLQKKINFRKDEEKTRLKGSLKEVPNGMLFILGNTEKNRRSKTVKNIFIDEAALFGKGHIKELIGRTKFFEKTGRKIFTVSSRKFPGDEIETQFVNSYCKKELQIECNGCKEYFYPTSELFSYMSTKEYKEKYDLDKIENMNNYKREAKETAVVICSCGHKTNSRDIEDLIRLKKVKLVVVEGDESDTIHGYKLNALATGLTKYSTMAEGLIEAGDDEEVLITIHQDYFNETFTKKDKSVASSDVTLLANKYEEFVVPNDTVAMYLNIDTQKGYYWATILAFEYGMNSHLVWAGRVEDEHTIETLMDREFFYKDGSRYVQGIKRTGQDWQGYKEIKDVINDETGEITRETVVDMPQRVKEFAYKMAEKYGADKDGIERFYATRGELFLHNDDMFRFTNSSVTVKNYKDVRKIKTLKLGTVALKSAFMSALMRNIAKQKALEGEEAYEYEGRLHYINKTLADKLKNRDSKGVFNQDYDRQVTAEVFTNPKDRKGKPKDYKSWVNIRNDNHYLDCNAIGYALATMDNIASLRKPAETNKKDMFVVSRGLI